METSLRYDGAHNHLFIHAKEKFLIDHNQQLFFQIHGRLNTHIGSAGGIAKFKRRFNPEISTNLDLGVTYDSEIREFTCDLQGKKSLSLTDNGLISVDTKGWCNYNPKSQKVNHRGVVELTYKKFNFTQDQDVRLKIGFNIFEKKPYLQIRENNWTLNTDINGRWSVRYDL